MTRHPLFRAAALLSAVGVVAALVIHAGCKTLEAGPDPSAAATATATASASAITTATATATAAAATPSVTASATASVAAPPDPTLPPPSRVHMGASKSGLVIRGDDLANAPNPPPQGDR